MAHIVIGLVIFAICTWAVFSSRICDGFFGRHLLTFAAIASAGFAYSGNPRAFLTSYALLMVFFCYYLVRDYRRMNHAKMD